MSLKISITRDDLKPALKKLGALKQDMTPVMLAVGNTFKSITEGNFNSVGADMRPAPWKAKADGSPSILQKSTTMAKSFHLTVTPKSATVGNPMVYAAIHQFGGEIQAKPGKSLKFKIPNVGWRTVKKVRIPARPFYPVTEDRRSLTPAALELVRAAGLRAVQRLRGSS